jgi:hypothetical protein
MFNDNKSRQRVSSVSQTRTLADSWRFLERVGASTAKTLAVGAVRDNCPCSPMLNQWQVQPLLLPASMKARLEVLTKVLVTDYIFGRIGDGVRWSARSAVCQTAAHEAADLHRHGLISLVLNFCSVTGEASEVTLPYIFAFLRSDFFTEQVWALLNRGI